MIGARIPPSPQGDIVHVFNGKAKEGKAE